MIFPFRYQTTTNLKIIILFILIAISLSTIYFFRHHVNKQIDNLSLSALTLLSSNSVQPQGYPRIGFWMIAPNGQPADWLGKKYNGKQLIEPINIVIVDSVAVSGENAKERLIEAMTLAGYPARTGHSSGYSGYIAKILYSMLPEQKNHSFSNKHPELDNNHGRIFGPHQENNLYYFIGAFSRENIAPLGKIKHTLASFNQARNDVAQKFDEKTSYKIKERLKLGNSLLNNLLFTTGDHDGTAIVVFAQE